MLPRSLAEWLTFGALSLQLGCAADKPGNNGESGNNGSDGAALGNRVYQQPLTDGNSFACSTCHALSEPSADGSRRPGHPIGDATRRSRWKNGRAASFIEATNSCVTEWQRAPAWTATEPRFVALRDFLDAEASASASASAAPDLAFEIVEPPVNVAGGDSERGRALFDDTCAVCHGAGGVGTIRGPSIAGSKREPSYIAERIRKSGNPTSSVYDGLTGGVMPFWAKDRLSDPELRDLIAFITAPVAPPDGAGGSGGVANPGGSGGGNTGCSATHPRVGFRADLGINTGEGQVRGLVTMVDDCTLELSEFSYDGNGIDVRVYGSKNQNFQPGFSIGPDLFGKQFERATLRVQLPAGKTLDDLDWVSIWCVAVGANFGSGPFLAP